MRGATGVRTRFQMDQSSLMAALCMSWRTISCTGRLAPASSLWNRVSRCPLMRCDAALSSPTIVSSLACACRADPCPAQRLTERGCGQVFQCAHCTTLC